MLTPQQVPLFIGGDSRTASHRFEVRDPGRTRDVVAEVDAATPDDVESAVAAAESAASNWREREVEERVAVLRGAADTIEQKVDALSELLARENGSVRWEARLDLQRGIDLLRATLDEALVFLPSRTVSTEQHWLRIENRPVGVVGLVVPWNSPVVLTMAKLAPALVAGNTVVIKPSPLAPAALTLTLTALAQLLPAGAVNIVNGDADVGSAISAHPRIRKVSFTGSVNVGKQILRDAASNVKRVTLELGGNDPAVLLDDVDINEAVGPLCTGAFMRAGQICFAVKRIYAPRARYDEIYDAICAQVATYQVGHGMDEQTTFGPMISSAQLDRVKGIVEKTRAQGAHVAELGTFLTPGLDEEGHYMLPVIARDIPQGAELVAVEQFGPVIPLVAYDTVDQAVVMANDSEFGLASSVWSEDTDRAIAVASRLDAGVSFINSHNVWSLSFDMPFGGVKQSGLGRERTALGLQEYVEPHVIRLIKPPTPLATTGTSRTD